MHDGVGVTYETLKSGSMPLRSRMPDDDMA